VSLVLDASMAVAAVHDDETTSEKRRLLERVMTEGAYVPSIWRLEVGHVLYRSVRQGRYSPSTRDRYFEILSRLPIEADSETDQAAWIATRKLVDLYKLTFYDACYLELATRMTLPLATLDDDLQAAAKAEGVEVLKA